jgi:hypothetical protein
VNQEITWANCTLRTWLNETFYDKAFSAIQQGKILASTVAGKEESTTDKIFILSYTEATNYFSSADSRICNATNYAIYRGAPVNTEGGQYDGNCCWMIRPTESTSYMAYVFVDGSINMGRYLGASVNADVGIRPAMWISTAG